MNQRFVIHDEGVFIEESRKIEYSLRSIALITLPVLALLVLTKLVAVGTGVTIRQLTQDPTTTLNAPFYTGALSNIGILFRASAAAISMFTAFVVGRNGSGVSRFLLLAGVLTTALLLDDPFLIHDEVLPQYFGVDGDALGALYMLLLGVLLGCIAVRSADPTSASSRLRSGHLRCRPVLISHIHFGKCGSRPATSCWSRTAPNSWASRPGRDTWPRLAPRC